MAPYIFAHHYGHLPRRADRIARRFGGRYITITEPNGARRGWLELPRALGAPHDALRAKRILLALRAEGIKI